MNIDNLFSEHYDYVLGYVRMLVHNREDAEDLTQETFVKILNHIDSYDSSRPFLNWAIPIAKNCFIDYMRKRSSETSGINRFTISLSTNIPCDDSIDEQIDNLVGKDRILHILSNVAHLSVPEISELTGIPRGTIGPTLSRINHGQ